MEFKIKSSDRKFRVKELNAIEGLSLKSIIRFDTFEHVSALYSKVLELIEVECEGKWLPVKEKDREVYYPVDIEKNVQAIQELINYFLLEYYKPIFMTSVESKN